MNNRIYYHPTYYRLLIAENTPDRPLGRYVYIAEDVGLLGTPRLLMIRRKIDRHGRFMVNPWREHELYFARRFRDTRPLLFLGDDNA